MLRSLFSLNLILCLIFQMSESAFAKSNDLKKKTKTARSQNYDRIKKSGDFFSTKLFSSNFSCDSNDYNFFSLNQASGCVPSKSDALKEKNRAQTDIGEALYKGGCSNASPDISVNFGNPDSVKYCKNVSRCLGATFAYIDSMEPLTSQKMQCTLLFLTDTHKTMRMDKSVQNVFGEINKKDSLDNKLTKLMKLVTTNLPKSELKNVHFCPMRIKDDSNCVAGMSNELISAQVNKYLTNVKKKEADSARIMNAQNQAVYIMVNNMNIHPALRKRNQLQASANPDRGVQNAAVVDESDEDGSNFADFAENSAQLDLKKQNMRSQMSNENFRQMLVQTSNGADKLKTDKFKTEGVASVKLEKEDTFFEVVRKFDINYDELSESYINNEINLEVPKDTPDYSKRVGEKREEIYSKYLTSVANKILDKYCDQSIVYNSKNYCAKIESELRDNDEIDRYQIMDKIGSYVDYQQAENANNKANGYAGISSKMIKDATRKEYDKKFNYAEFMSQVGFMQTCIQHFGKNSFNSEDEENQFSQLNSSSDESAIEKTNHVASDQSRNLREVLLSRSHSGNDAFFANSIDKSKVNPAASIADLGNKDVLKGDTSGIGDKKINSAIYGESTHALNSNGQSDIGMYNTLTNSIKNNSQATPTNANNNSYVYQPTNSNFNDRSAEYEPNSIQKKLDELTKKEAALKSSSSETDSNNSSPNSKEVDSLQKQIEELRSQLAESKKVNSNNINPASKDVAIKDNAIASATSSPNFDFKKQTYGTSNTNQNDRSSDSSSSNDSSRFESASIGSSGGGSANQAINSRAIASVSNAKVSDSVKSFGLVLTKSGESTEDISKIADNPKESDILILAEKSNGKPFIIRENGDLVQVQIKTDANGKPIYVNGKPEYIKKKLSKEAQVQVAKNLNAIREAKEVRDTVRLQQLNQLMQDSK